MKLKIERKLSLNKETIAKINEEQMRAILGGANQETSVTTVRPTDPEEPANFVAGSTCCSTGDSACC